jgi:FKBP-type peptidyl-prolyl cis-trans isomerase FklB
MKHLTTCLITLAAGVAFMSSATAEDKKENIDVSTLKGKVSYGIGLNIGATLKNQGLNLDNVDPKILGQGIADVFAGKEPLISPATLQLAMQEFQRKMAKAQKERAEKSREAGDKYLADNKKKKGVIVTKSGLQYEVIKKGDGATPKASDTVKTHYHGTLINGTVFDSSVDRDKPATFPVGRVIAGWTEALQLMKVGDKWKLTIPSELAYGKRGSPPKIAPDSVLVFEIELLGIE